MYNEIFLHDEIDADVNYFNQVYASLCEDRTNQHYYSNSYNNLMSQNDKTIRSIRTNGDALICYLSTPNQNFDIICLTETWMMDLESVNDVLQDYNQ